MFRLENHSTSEFVRRTAEIAENAEERLYGAYLDVLPVNRARTATAEIAENAEQRLRCFGCRSKIVALEL